MHRILLLLIGIMVVLLISRTEGFVNSPPIRGRYITLERQQVGWINLADIQVFSEKGGRNIITPSTVVTMSNVHAGAPASNFVDGNPTTMTHNATESKGGPLTIDLGSSVPIFKIVVTNRYDCCRERANGTILTIQNESKQTIYTADPMTDKSGNKTYTELGGNNSTKDQYYYTFTYFPPETAVLGDVEGPVGAFNNVKNVRVTSAGTGYEIMPSFTPKATGLTFSAWFVLTGMTLPAQWSRIFDMATTTPSPTTATVLAFDGDGGLHCFFSVAGPYIEIISRTKLALRTIYHVAWTIDASGVHKLYLNGKEEGTGNKALSTQAFPHFFLGKSNWTSDPYPNMTIFDFRMFDRALTVAEVITSAESTRPAPSSMIGWIPAEVTSTAESIQPSSMIGPAGPAGPAGPVGPVGAPGVAGAPGPAGVAGVAGVAGAPGVAGPEGKIGPVGPAGPIGLEGKLGPAGPAGPAGLEGKLGPAGPAGPVGSAGPIGSAGPMGPMGPIGPVGPEQRSILLELIQHKVKRYLADQKNGNIMEEEEEEEKEDITPFRAQGKEYSRSTYKK